MGSATIVLVEPDPFLKTSKLVTDYIPNYRHDDESMRKARKTASKSHFDMEDIQRVSRPLNGIVVKPNTHAYIQVVDANQKVLKVFNQLGLPGHAAMSGGRESGMTGNDIQKAEDGTRNPKVRYGAKDGTPHVDAGFFGDPVVGRLGSSGAGMDEKGNPTAGAWTDWILQNVREARVEKTQLVETFGDSYLYAYGEKPRVLGFSGMLMNTPDYNWRAVFWENWDMLFRATKLIEKNARMYIGWEDIIVEGYPIQAVAQETADSPNGLSFSFQFYVTNYFNMSMANKTSMIDMKRMYQLSMSESSYLHQKVHQAQIKDSRWSVFNKVLGKGAASHAFFWDPPVYNSATGEWDSGKSPSSMSAWEKMGHTFAKQVASMAVKAPYKLTTMKQANIAQWINSSLGQMQYQAMMSTKNILTQGAEKWMGAIPGEINAWFGYVGMLMDNTMTADGGRWDGKGEGAGLDMLRGGSLDRLIQRMSYHLQGAMSMDVDRYDDSYGNSNDKAGTGPTNWANYPGVAVAMYNTPMNPSSHTDFAVEKFTLDVTPEGEGLEVGE